jgi:hypothetical protein
VDARDPAGNEDPTPASRDFAVDTTPPQVHINSPIDGATYVDGQRVKAEFAYLEANVKDWVLDPAPVDGLLTMAAGALPQTFTATVRDKAGNSGSASVTYTVPMVSAGVAQPINPDGSSLFSKRSTIPIKIAVSNTAGQPWTGLSPTLSYKKLSNGVWGDESEAVSTNKPDSGNVMRESMPGVYIFNLDARSLGTGTFQMIIDLGGEARIYGQFSIQ